MIILFKKHIFKKMVAWVKKEKNAMKSQEVLKNNNTEMLASRAPSLPQIKASMEVIEIE